MSVRWRAQAHGGSAALIDDDRLGLVLHASEHRERARVPLSRDDLRELRRAIDGYLRETRDEADDGDVW